MSFLLSSQNVFDYLISHNLCTQADQQSGKVEPKFAKNFNLLLSLASQRKLLVKQERHDQEGKTIGEFSKEWRIHQLLQEFPELAFIQSLISEAIHFDTEHSIIVFNYLEQYRDLHAFYDQEKLFPTLLAKAIGTSLATIHKATFKGSVYREFLTSNQNQAIDVSRNIARGLDRLDPEIFSLVPGDGLKFFVLYQRYDSLREAIADLDAHIVRCCLTHNDLKLDNVLLHDDWQSMVESSSSQEMVRLIDWERAGWGDPAFDLGRLISGYLQLWLGSLVISKEIAIEDALRLAIVPLDLLQSSIKGFIQSYLAGFPELLEQRPDFIRRSMQCAGIALIHQIQATIQYQKTFGNTEISMLQVAKSLLCRPEQAILSVVGVPEASLVCSHAVA